MTSKTQSVTRVNQADLPKEAAPKNLGGRPPKLHPDEATLKILRGLAQIQATTRECAAMLGVHENTYLKFIQDYPEARDASDFGRGQGKVSLRRKQFRLAEKNAAMAIFLGKNYLGQTDRQEHVGPDGGPIRFNLTGLSEEELEHLERLRSRIAITGGDQGGEGEASG